MSPQTRIGIGFDIHRLEAGNGIVLGGVSIPCDKQLIAHSDGDVVLHAICDALLGAVAAGDIGEHFSDTDAANSNRPSSEFVHGVLALPALAGWTINNIDVNIIAETPRLSQHKAQIRQTVADIFGCDLDRISIKARSHEGLDAIGNKEAISAQAVVLLERQT